MGAVLSPASLGLALGLLRRTHAGAIVRAGAACPHIAHAPDRASMPTRARACARLGLQEGPPYKKTK
eukprot:12203711-Karenia_brevis.AAC.1